MNIKTIGRRKFFIGAGLSAVALTLLSKSPLNLLNGNNSKVARESISLKINPSAVMRNKKA